MRRCGVRKRCEGESVAGIVYLVTVRAVGVNKRNPHAAPLVALALPLVAADTPQGADVGALGVLCYVHLTHVVVHVAPDQTARPRRHQSSSGPVSNMAQRCDHGKRACGVHTNH